MNSRLIVIEGPDGGGKSTLVKNCFPDAVHRGGPPKTKEGVRCKIALTPKEGILDRWTPISEWVYGTVLRGEPLIPVKELLDAILERMPVIIYCRPPTDVLMANAKKQTVKDHKPSDHIAEIQKHQAEIIGFYDSLMKRLQTQHGVPICYYDYTGDQFL